MLEVILSGGLGNQLFQYAFGRYLSQIRGEQLVLNTYRLSVSKTNETPRDFYLGSLNLNAHVFSQKRMLGLNRPLDFILRKGIMPGYGHESNDLKKNIYFGYWLDQKFPNATRNSLLKELTLKQAPTKEFQDTLTSLEHKKVLAVHVRRGDYVNNLQAKSLHGVLDITYYKNALDIALKFQKYDDVFIFSDDPIWCKEQFPGYTVIQPFVENPFLDMYLMSKCHSNVIANSTFSWWAAWLNQNPDKVTIAPKKWFSTLPNPQIYDEKWRMIE